MPVGAAARKDRWRILKRLRWSGDLPRSRVIKDYQDERAAPIRLTPENSTVGLVAGYNACKCGRTLMRRQRKPPQHANTSLESILQQREGRPFCPKCERFVRHRDAVWIARRQCRCPVCGELLERRVEENGQPATSAQPQ